LAQVVLAPQGRACRGEADTWRLPMDMAVVVATG